MTRSKLSDLEKQEIVSLFEQQQETIVSLAQRYQVSSSTIRRLLKSPLAETNPAITVTPEAPAVDTKPKLIRRRSQSALPENSAQPIVIPAETLSPVSLPAPDSPHRGDKPTKSPISQRPSRRSIKLDAGIDSLPEENTEFDAQLVPSTALASDEISAILEDIGHGLEQSFASSAAEEDDEDEDFDDLEDESDDLDELDELSVVSQTLQLRSEGFIEVMPFEQAVLPKICYLVIDRTAELVTRPLKDFGELGQVPEHEVQSCTLPVFDNHRIARRFSHRTQRIIKIPNGNMLKTTCNQLSAKGITRLLVNGNIYAL